MCTMMLYWLRLDIRRGHGDFIGILFFFFKYHTKNVINPIFIVSLSVSIVDGKAYK